MMAGRISKVPRKPGIRSAPLTPRLIQDYLDAARGLSVLVVGEAIIDEYQYCEAIGKSSKEPMLVVKALRSEKFAGGILAVANHVANFAERVTAVTALGDLNPQEEFIRSRLNPRVTLQPLRRKDAPTIVKRRLIESYFFTKLVEVYEINDMDLDEDDNRAFCTSLRRALPAYDVVIVVDYGHGLISREAIELLCGEAKYLAVNAQANAGNLGYHTISMYPRADYITMTEAELRLEARSRRGEIHQMIQGVAAQVDCPRIVVTRGKAGCVGYEKDRAFWEIPALAEKVVDRVGAGDAFLSISALCAARGAPMDVVALVGNLAAAQAVVVVGNRSPVDRAELLRQAHRALGKRGKGRPVYREAVTGGPQTVSGPLAGVRH